MERTEMPLEWRATSNWEDRFNYVSVTACILEALP